jgi:translocation and assembly module TamB
MDAPARRVRWPAAARWALGLLATMVVVIVVAVWAIDTGPGHRLVVDRIARLAPSSGLRVRIGRIEGSLWTRMRLRDVRLYDPKGLFLQSPAIELDWRPLGWLRNTLDLRSLHANLLILHKAPQLRSTGARSAILPGFDIRVGSLAIERLRIEPALAGRRQVARVTGDAVVHDARARIRLSAKGGAGDRIALLLDAAPDSDRFDVDAQVQGPAGGLVSGLFGSRKAVALSVIGDGRWHAWRGTGRLEVGGAPILDLALGARDGVYSLVGSAQLQSVTAGKLQRLSAPRIAIDAHGTLADRRLATRVDLRSAALAVRSQGTIDLATSSFDPLRIDARLLHPPAMFPNMSGSAVRLVATLRGAFGTAAFDYAASAQRVAFDQTGFERVRATGRGRLSKAAVSVPIRLAAERVTGVGDVAGGILRNLSVAGVLKVTPKLLTGQGLAFRSDKLGGKLSLLVDLVTGRYDVTLSGGLQRYLIPGIGIVDVTSDVSVVPGPGGIGTRVVGRGRAIVRRFDNAFLRGLAGGLPRIDTQFERLRDGSIRFTGLRLRGPSIDISGSGLRRRDGTFLFEGGGTQAQYGRFRIVLDGNISRPRIALALDAPMAALGLRDVSVGLDPGPQGFAYRASGGSMLGAFTSSGAILLPGGAPAVIAVSDLAVSGTHARGQLRSDPGGFTGRLAVAGGGLDGALLFNPVGDIQRIEAHLAAANAAFEGPPPITVVRGRLDAVALLDPAGTSIDATVVARGLKRGGLSLARLDLTAKLRGGAGTVSANLAGSRGRAFEIRTRAEIAPDRYRITGEGIVDRRAIRLTSPAELTRAGDGWRLAPTSLAFEGGSATVAGRFGASDTTLDARLARLPLSVLDIAYPGLGLGGVATGTVTYAQTGEGAPTGRADIRVRGLTRSGLVLSSQPVDLGVAAVLDARGAATRMVVSSGGQVIGRGQARLAPLGTAGGLAERLAAAPLFGQLRYTGPADTLWRLTGVELVDLSGPVAIGADVSGRLAAPIIRGSVQTTRARLESSVTGTVIDNLAMRGRFDGSRLLIDQLTGTTRGAGRISGRAAFDFAAARGFGIEIALQAERAELLNSDDIGATVTGPVTIRSDGAGGVIGGDVDIVRGRFRLGQAAAVEAVPRLNVREINRPADEAADTGPILPWTLDMRARARNRLAVTGLGLDSEWRADLQLKGQVDNPSITGTADLVRGGYEFAGRRFELERGQIRFTGETPADPTLDISAEADIRGLNATIRVTGTGQKPDISFTSIPALPEDELLSRLLFGTSITNLSAPEALQLAAAVASLRDGGGGGLNPINAVRKAAGLDRLRILPADTATGQRTSVAAGKYLTRRVYIEVATDGQGYSATRVEWELTRWLSVLSSISTLGRTSANVRISRDY